MHKKMDEVLEAVYEAVESKDNSMARIKENCHVTITEDLLEKMQKIHLIVFNQKEIYLTPEGTKQAVALIRRKRLAEVLLFNAMQYSGDHLSRAACKYEHAVYPEIEESICILLGHPTTCPHGKPIPGGTCCEAHKTMVEQKVTTLNSLRKGESGRITSINTEDDQTLNKLYGMGIKNGKAVSVRQHFPSFIVEVDHKEVAMDKEMSKSIFLTCSH